MSAGGWIGVDLDGTLAHYTSDDWKGPEHIGPPVPRMLARVKAWLADGRDVRIFTARVAGLYMRQDEDSRVVPTTIAREDAENAMRAVRAWCRLHIGRELPVVALKDYGMVELWDDRCVQVIPNTGERADVATNGEFDALCR